MTTTLPPPLRRALKTDCRALAELINEAGDGLPLILWRPRAEAEGMDPFDFGASRAGREGGNFSYRNAVVAETENGAVAAMMLAYRLPESEDAEDLAKLPDLLRTQIELESKVPGSFYINAIAAYPAYRGQGLGSKLMAMARDLARERACALLSLIASRENTSAVRLYKRLGFSAVASAPIPAHRDLHFTGDWLLMTCPV